jgi:hypothetical protein
MALGQEASVGVQNRVDFLGSLLGKSPLSSLRRSAWEMLGRSMARPYAAFPVPVTNFIRASKAGAPDPSGDNVETEPIAPGQPPGNGCVKRADGRRRDTRRPASLDHRGGQPRYSGGALIPVMKSADLRDRDDALAR